MSELSKALDEFYRGFRKKKRKPVVAGIASYRKKIHSESMAVRRDQIEKAREKDKRIGAPTTSYDALGRPIFESTSHQRRYLKAHGKHDGVPYANLDSYD